MIGYVTLGTNDLARARAFYDALLGELGARRMMEMPDAEGGFTLYGTGTASASLAVTRPYNGQPATAGNGTMVALQVGSRDTVDALHARALALGGTCEGPPGLRGSEAMGFYAAYFRDPEGNKLAVFNHSPGG
jgi:catechol 2,3-dioxygenase-like lactoylglutathione lyase family enzyme